MKLGTEYINKSKLVYIKFYWNPITFWCLILVWDQSYFPLFSLSTNIVPLIYTIIFQFSFSAVFLFVFTCYLVKIGRKRINLPCQKNFNTQFQGKVVIWSSAKRLKIRLLDSVCFWIVIQKDILADILS